MAMTFEQALEIAIEEVKDTYAQFYLSEVQSMLTTSYGYTENDWNTQLMYCLSNMQQYRGETARQVKKAFRAKIKELSQ